MKLPTLKSDSDINESLIKHLTETTRLQQFENVVPGCTERLLTEAVKQLSHRRKRFWARLIVTLILGLAAINKSPAEIMHTLIGAF